MPVTSLPDVALLPIFDALPAPYLLLSPDLIIEAVSDAYLAATLTQRAGLLGRHLFDAFPDNPAVPEARATHNLRASLAQVLATGQPHEMAPQQYDVPDPAHPGQFVERHWLPRNAPVLDEQGRVARIIHAVSDITTQRYAELELRASHSREQEAYADTEAQRQQLYQTFQEAPAMICIFDGPKHVFQFVNPPYQALVGNRPLVGKPIAEAMPELKGQPIFDLLDNVYRTGETFRANEMLVQLDHNNSRQRTLEERYYNFSYTARHSTEGLITGIFVFAYDVTVQVLARQQVQELNEELAATNEELHASNEEYLLANTALTHTQLQLLQLNQELEARVAARTQDALAARATTERQRQRLENLLMRAPAAICIFGGPNWVYELVNPGYQQMFPGRQLLGLPLLEALPEVAGQPLVNILQAVYDTGIPFEGKEVLVPLARTADGPIEDIYFDLTYQARYDETGQIDGFITYAYDVTEQMRLRQARETEQMRLQSLFMAAPAAICILGGPELVYELVNPTYQQLFPGRQLLGHTMAQAFPELVGHSVLATYRRVYETGITNEEQAILLPFARPADGVLEDRYFHYVQQARYDEHGCIDGVLVFAFEVTEQVLASQQVQNLNEKLAAINEELTASIEELNDTNAQLTRTNVDLDNFIYTASHDLKQPIANIEGLLLALTHELPSETQQTTLVGPILERMQGAVERFQRTIADLTEVSKLQQANAQPAQVVYLHQAIREVELDLAPVLLASQGQLEVAVPLDQVVTFSEKNLRSVVYNLLSNALKYRSSDRPPRVRITSALVAGRVELRVQDNGLGLDERQQIRLFGLFQRLHTHVEGTGIGLYMVKKIVENAGGTITAQSVLGVGTTFIVSLPG